MTTTTHKVDRHQLMAALKNIADANREHSKTFWRMTEVRQGIRDDEMTHEDIESRLASIGLKNISPTGEKVAMARQTTINAMPDSMPRALHNQMITTVHTIEATRNDLRDMFNHISKIVEAARENKVTTRDADIFVENLFHLWDHVQRNIVNTRRLIRELLNAY